MPGFATTAADLEVLHQPTRGASSPRRLARRSVRSKNARLAAYLAAEHLAGGFASGRTSGSRLAGEPIPRAGRSMLLRRRDLQQPRWTDRGRADLGRAVPRPGGAPRGARGRRAAVQAGLRRPHLRQPGGQGRTGRWRATSGCATATATCSGATSTATSRPSTTRVLKANLRRRIACRRALAVLDRIIDASNPQEPVNLHYSGDDLFTPFERRGLPIGNLNEPALRQRVPRPLRPLRQRGAPCAVPALRRRLRAVRRRPGAARGLAAPPDRVPGASGVCRCIRRRRTWRRCRPRRRSSGSSCGRRPSSAAGGERAALPQPPAGSPRPLAGGHRHARGSGAAGSRLGADTWRMDLEVLLPRGAAG